MRRDLDALLRARGLAAAVVVKGELPNATFRYLLGPPAADMTTAIVIWRPGEKPFLVHASMERDAAARTGFERADYGALEYRKILEREGNPEAAMARLLERLFDRLGISGRILMTGVLDLASSYPMMNLLREYRPSIEFARDEDPGLFALARLSKDADEIEAIRAAGRACARAYERVRATIAGGRIRGGELGDAEGPITIGRLRRGIRRVFFEAGLEEPHGNIVAMGRDAAVPHNSGNDEEVVVEGKAITIDLYPVQAGGGYYFDVTRTICAGRAPAELKEIHGIVREALDLSIGSLHVGAPARSYQEKVCDLFEARGHRTIRQDPCLEEGYVHGLGHGIGLEVHERPYLGGSATNKDRIEPGSVFTIEPGLYYPSRGIGVRLEDVVLVHPDGRVENLTDVPYELEIAPA
ncbi:MAG: M24 family metallopeptidase [Hyphomicrobiales bacterium]